MNSSRNESARAQARLQTQAPVSGEAELAKFEEQVAEVLRKSGEDSPGAAFELQSIARDYFGHVARKKAKAARSVREKPGKR